MCVCVCVCGGGGGGGGDGVGILGWVIGKYFTTSAVYHLNVRLESRVPWV